MADCLFKPVPAGLAVALRVTPNAARERIEGIAADADGNPYLKVAVTVPPENGKANAAVIKLIAKDLHLPKTSLSIASGAAARRKTLLIAGNAKDLEIKLNARITEWLKLRTAA
jgi:uncharacterized protein (TIGR00251 family)